MLCAAIAGCASSPSLNKEAPAYSHTPTEAPVYIYTPTDESAQKMTPAEAQKVFIESMQRQYSNIFKSIFFSPDGGNITFVRESPLPQSHLALSDWFVPKVTEYQSGIYCVTYNSNNSWSNECFKDEPSSKLFADAVYELENDSAIQAPQFLAAAAEYRAARPKPQLSDEARKYAVQAADAASQNQFSDAIQLYQQALSIAPWWPEGHYNLALLLANQNLYNEAIGEMKKYLALVPGASDAQKAQDQIWIWERRESSQ